VHPPRAEGSTAGKRLRHACGADGRKRPAPGRVRRAVDADRHRAFPHESPVHGYFATQFAMPRRVQRALTPALTPWARHRSLATCASETGGQNDRLVDRTIVTGHS